MTRLLVLLSLLAWAAGAFAGGSSMPPPPPDLTPADTDLSMTLLQQIIGQWGGTTGVTFSGLAAAMAVFNTAVLGVGTVMFAWMTIIGIVQTAHDGEVFGKKWSSMWVPLRLLVGVAMLIPTGSGFCAIQLLIIGIAAQGVGLGNKVWSAYLNGSTSDRTVSVQLVNVSQIEDVMRQALASEACVAYIAQRTPAQAPTGQALFGINSGGYADLSGTTLSWGQLTATQAQLEATYGGDPGYAFDVCGSVSFPKISDAEMDAERPGLATSTTWLRSALVNVRKANVQVAKAQQAALIQAVAADLRPLAIEMARPKNGNEPGVTKAQTEAAISHAAATYHAAVSASMAQAMSASSLKDLSDSFKRSAETFGWINAGLHYYAIGLFQAELGKVIGTAPQADPPKWDSETMRGAMPQWYITYVTSLAAARKESELAARDRMTGVVKAPQGQQGFVFDLVNRAGSGAAMYAGSKFGYDPTSKDPVIVQLKNSGDALIALSEVAITGYLISSALPNWLPGAGLAKGAAAMGAKILDIPFLGKLLTAGKTLTEPIGFIAFFACMGVLMLGITLSIYIPMLPFILWIGVIFGFIATVLEALVAAPLWAAAHFSPEGDSLAGKWGANGYSIVIEVFSKPVLSIFGLIAALLVMEPFFAWFSSGFWYAMQGSQSNSVTGLVTVIAYVTLYVSVCLAVFSRVLGLMHSLPAQVSRWIGTHWSSYMDQGFEQKIEGSARQGTAKAKGVMQQGIGTYRTYSMESNRRQRAESGLKKGSTPAGGGAPNSREGKEV